MSGLDNLNIRLNYHGGHTDGRLNRDKLWSLRDALHNSYQGETAILNDKREFKCLINPDKLKPESDNKILSIPYQDICLNPELSNYIKDNRGWEQIGLKTGETFTWKETNTHWLVTLQYLEESAYFRSDIVRCDQQVDIDGTPYWVHIRGPVETSVPWNQKAGVEWNDLNFSLVMYITQDEHTKGFFKRFKKLKIQAPHQKEVHTWQVVGCNSYYGDGVFQVFLDEFFDNTIEEEIQKETENNKPIPPIPEPNMPMIEGPMEVKKYDTVTFECKNFTTKGKWYLIMNDKEQDLKNESNILNLDITRSKGSFKIKYKSASEEAFLDVKIIAF